MQNEPNLLLFNPKTKIMKKNEPNFDQSTAVCAGSSDSFYLLRPPPCVKLYAPHRGCQLQQQRFSERREPSDKRRVNYAKRTQFTPKLSILTTSCLSVLVATNKKMQNEPNLVASEVEWIYYSFTHLLLFFTTFHTTSPPICTFPTPKSNKNTTFHPLNQTKRTQSQKHLNYYKSF
jgi:hypothetical protein